MAQVQRSDTNRRGDPMPLPPVADNRYDPGGHVARLQADLAQRLTSQGVAPTPSAAFPSERIVRLISVGGGYLALAAGYAAVAVAVARWL